MTAAKSLPDRPSLESLRKQAKKLARDRFLSLRDAQLVLAREYGFAGWQDLTAEVSERLGKGLEWAVAQARRIIHNNDVERLKQLLAEYPALLSWQGNDWDSQGGLLGIATGAYADAGDAQREQWFTRGACAELLIEAGAVVMPSVCEGLLQSRAKGLLHLFQRKGLLPRTLKFFAALGDLDAVRATLDERARHHEGALATSGNDLETVNDVFVCACRFKHDAVAALLLERSIALDPDLSTHIDGDVDRHAFVTHFVDHGRSHAKGIGLWIAFVMDQISLAAHQGDVTSFVTGFQREPRLLGDDWVDFQNRLIGAAILNDREAIIGALFDLDPAIMRRQPPPSSQAIEFALTYAKPHLIPLLTRIWPVPNDLPHQAGMGNLSRVKQWFDESGAPALGDLEQHYPRTSSHVQAYDDLHWGSPTAQHVLDTALAFAVTNRHFDVADFLLERGADINTNWNSHEPASLLHHLVFVHRDYEAMQFLIDRGIDMTIKDYRWNSTAAGWARYAMHDEKLALWLEDAQRSRKSL
jgi:Ankyrin repeat